MIQVGFKEVQEKAVFGISFMLMFFIFTFGFYSGSNLVKAQNVIPGELEITEIMADSKTGLRWIEIINRANRDIDVTGFEVKTTSIVSLLPTTADIKFIVPKDYILLLTNNVNLLQDSVAVSLPVILLEVKNLEINSYGGEIVIRDQLNVEIEKISYGDHSHSSIIGLSIEKNADLSFQDSEVKGGTPGVINYYHKFKKPEKPFIQEEQKINILEMSDDFHDEVDKVFLNSRDRAAPNLKEEVLTQEDVIRYTLSENFQAQLNQAGGLDEMSRNKETFSISGYQVAASLIFVIFIFFMFGFYKSFKEGELKNLGL